MNFRKKMSASLAAGSLILASLVATQVFGVASSAQAADERAAVNAPTGNCGLVGNSAVTYSYMTYLRDEATAGNAEKSADYIKNSAFIEPVVDSSLPANQRKWKATFNAGPISVTSDEHYADYTSNPWFTVFVSKGWKFVEGSLSMEASHKDNASSQATVEKVNTSKFSLANREIHNDPFHKFSDGESLNQWYVIGRYEDDNNHYYYPSAPLGLKDFIHLDVHSFLRGVSGTESAGAPSLMRLLNWPGREDGSRTGEYFSNNARSAFTFNYYTKSNLRDRMITVYFKTEVDPATESEDGKHFVGATYKSYDNGHRHMRSVAAVTPANNCLQSTPIRVNIKEKIADDAANKGAKIPAHDVELSTIERFGRDNPVTLAINTRTAPLEQDYTYYSTGAAYDHDVMQLVVKGIGSNASSAFSWFDWNGTTYKGRYAGMEYKITHDIDLKRDTDRTPVSEWLIEWYPIPDQPLPPEFELSKVTKLFVQKKPAKLEYVQGEKLNIADTIVTLEDSNLAHKQILANEFSSYGIKVTPANDSVLNTVGDSIPVKFALNSKPNVYDTIYVKVKSDGRPAAKLSVESLSVSPDQPEAGQATTLNGTVKKDGALVAGQKLWVKAGDSLYPAVTDEKGQLLDANSKKPISFLAGIGNKEMVIQVFDNDRLDGAPLKELRITPKGSPFNIVKSRIFIQAPAGANLIADNTAESGSQVWVRVVLNDEQGNIYIAGPADLKITVPGVSGEVSMYKHNNGTYSALVQPIKATTATASTPVEKADNLIKIVSSAGEYAKVNPGILNVVAGKAADKLDSSVSSSQDKASSITLAPQSIEVNSTPVKGTVTLKDKYGNPVRGAKPVISVNGKDDPNIVPVEKADAPGVYEFSYKPLTDGTQTIGVKENANSPVVTSAELVVTPKKGKTSAPQELKLHNNNGSWTLSGKAAPNSTVKVKLGDQEVASGTASNGSFSLPLSVAPSEANKLVSATATEASKEESESAQIEADLVAPAKAQITPVPFAGDKTLSVVLPKDKDIVKAKLTLPGETTPVEITKENGAWTAKPSGKIAKIEENPAGILVVTPTNPLAKGDLKVTLEDETGNTSQETVAPVAARGQTPAPTNLEVYKTADGLWRIKGIAEPGATVKVKLPNNGKEIPGFAGGRTGAFDIELDGALNDKDELKVTATKSPNTESPEAKVVVDAKAPVKPVIDGGHPGDTTIGVALPKEDDVARIEITLPGEDKPIVITKKEDGTWVDEKGKPVTIENGKLQVTIPELKPGKVEATVVDKSGNKSDAGESDIDNTPRTTAPTEVEAVKKDDGWHVVGKAEPGADITVKVPGLNDPVKGKADPTTGKFDVKLPENTNLGDGAKLEVTASKDGKVESVNTPVVVDNSVPSVPGVDPVKKGDTTVAVTKPTDPKAERIEITVPGQNQPIVLTKDQNGNWVDAAGQKVPEKDGKLQVKIPAAGDGNVSVVVTNKNGNKSKPSVVPVTDKNQPGGNGKDQSGGNGNTNQPVDTCKMPDFKDSAASPFYRHIRWMQCKGITKGWPDNTYRPQESISRVAMAAFLYRMAGSPEVKLPAVSPLSDMRPGDDFYKEVIWCYQSGITTGYKEDGSFRPNIPIARDAMAAFLHRYDNIYHVVKKVSPSAVKFPDVTSDNHLAADVDWLRRAGITTGYGDGTFRPYDPLSREAMAAFIYRMVNGKL